MAKAKDFSELELKQEQNVSTKVERELNAEFAARPSQFDGAADNVFMRGSMNSKTGNMHNNYIGRSAQSIIDSCYSDADIFFRKMQMNASYGFFGNIPKSKSKYKFDRNLAKAITENSYLLIKDIKSKYEDTEGSYFGGRVELPNRPTAQDILNGCNK